MKIVHGGSNVLASQGVKSKAQFQILANAQAFRILSSGLYSDKISAVLREIGCNAADAHIAQGTPDRPIEVKMPNAIDSSFYIKDYGPGLSHDEIMGLFTTYFSSNKSDNNDLTGAFGLGSKSPFSYTDTFSVTSVKDGTQRSYAAHIGEDGAPVISLLVEHPTSDDWMHGMMVSFPVRPKDLAEFDKKAKEVYRWFAVKPELIGTSPIDTPKFTIEGEGFKLGLIGDALSPAQPGRHGEKLARLLMGNVAYPIKGDRLEMRDGCFETILSSGIVITVPIGAVMPTASREDIEYDDNARTLIKAALEKVALTLGQRILALATDAAPNEWARHQRLRQFYNALPKNFGMHIPGLLKRTDASAEIQSAVHKLYLKEYHSLPNWVGSIPAKAGQTSDDEVPFNDQFFAVGLYHQSDRSKTAVRRSVIGGRIAVGTQIKDAKVSYLHTVTLLIVDGAYGNEKAKELIKTDEDAVILLDAGNLESKPNLMAFAQKLAQDLGSIEITRTSQLPEPAAIVERKALPKGVKVTVRPEVLHAKTEVKYFKVKAGSEFDRYRLVDTKLADIPVNGRFYVIANSKDSSTFKVDTRRGVKSFTYSDLHKGLQAYRRIIRHGIPLIDIGGIMVLVPGQVRDLQLREGGWQQLTNAMFESFKSKEICALITSRVNRMPKLLSIYSGSRHSSYEGLAGLLLMAAVKDWPFWKRVKPMLVEFPEFALIMQELVEAHTEEDPKSGLRVSLDEFLTQFSGASIALDDNRLTEKELTAKIIELHPMSEFIDGEGLAYKADRDPEGTAQFVYHVLLGRGTKLVA